MRVSGKGQIGMTWLNLTPSWLLVRACVYIYIHELFILAFLKQVSSLVFQLFLEVLKTSICDAIGNGDSAAPLVTRFFKFLPSTVV